MNDNENFNFLLKKAMGDESTDLFAVNAGLAPFAIDNILRGKEKPDKETLLRIARRAKNGVTYQQLYDAWKADEETDRKAHYLEYTREEDLERYFQKIARECNGSAMDSPVVFRNHMLEELRDLDRWVDEKDRAMYSVEYTGDERKIGKRVYRHVKFILPDGNLVYSVNGTASWLAGEMEEIRDCRFQMDDIEEDHRIKSMHERIQEIRQNLKEDCEEKTCEIPSVQEGYGFYVDDDHLSEAEKYCEAHRDLWPKDLEDPEQYSEYYADPDIHGTWQLTAGIMRSLYGIPFFAQKRESGYKGIPGAQMIMVEKFICEDQYPQDEVLNACKETAAALNIPSFGTVWRMEEESYPLIPEYPVKGMEEDMDQELEQLKMEIEEDPENMEVVVPYVELLNEKSKTARISAEIKEYLSKTQELEADVLQDDEVLDFINEMQERYRSLLKKENLQKLRKEAYVRIRENPDSSERYEQYLSVVKESVPYCSYEECTEILNALVEHSDAAMDYDEVLDLMDQLKEQMVQNDPDQDCPETKQTVQYIRNQYEQNPTIRNAEAYALCLYLNEKDPERIRKIKQLYHENPYDLCIAEQYASMMNRDVIRHEEYDVPMDKLEAYRKELSLINERFYASEKIGMADHNIMQYIRTEKQMNDEKPEISVYEK